MPLAEADSLGDVDLSGPAADRSSIASNATRLSGATIAARVCSLGLAIAMGRGLGVNVYGRYGFAAALGTIIVALADLGVTSYVWREVARDRVSGDIRAFRLGIIKIWLALAALALTAAAAVPLSGQLEAAEIVVVIVASMLVDGISSYVYGYFQGREQMGFEARWTALVAIVRSVGGIILVLAVGRLLEVVLWILTVSILQLAVTGRRLFSELDRRKLAERGSDAPIAWGGVIAMGSLTLFALVYLRADSVLLGVIKNRHAVGLYTAAYTVVGAVQIIPWQISQAVTPVLARTYTSNPSRFAEAWNEGLRIALLVSLPVALATAILATGVVTLPYGQAFASAGPALAVLIWAAPISGVNAIIAGALYGAGQERWPAICSGVGVLLNLGLNLWAIPAYGIVGAASVTVATEVAVLAGQMWFVVARKIAPIPRLPYGRTAIALALLAAVAVAARELPVVASGLLAVLAYVVVIVASGAFGRKELQSLRSA